MRRSAACLVAALALTSISACSVPTVPHHKGDLRPSKIAADETEISVIYDRYSKVRANALTQLDPDPLGTVENGPVLAIDAGSVRVAKLLSRSTRPDEQDLTVQRVLAPRVAAYPLWFVAIVRDGVRKVTKVQIFERASAVGQWELVASPEALLTTPLPQFALDDTGALEPIDADDGRGLDTSPQAAMKAYAAVLDDARSPDASKVVRDSFIQEMRADATRLGTIRGVRFTQKWGSKPVEFALRTADGGALVFATLLRQDGYAIQRGVAINWPVGSPEKAFLGGKLYTAGLLRYYHQVLMYVPASTKGRPRVLGQYGGVVDGQGY